MGKRKYLLCSFPKSGRTWLRFILANYFNIIYDLNIRLNFENIFHLLPNDSDDDERGLKAYRYYELKKIPLIISSHSSYDNLNFDRTPLVYLLRSVFDVLVSYYFHLSRQWKSYPDGISNFIRDGDKGLINYIEYINSFSSGLYSRKHRIVVYERLHRNTLAEVNEIIRFFRLPVDEASIRRAIEISSFDNMQKIEIEKGIIGHRYDRDDTESRRMRKGKVGGYTEYLNDMDVQYIKDTCHKKLTEASIRMLKEYNVFPE
jgi:alcohol sulfotransferase